MQYNEVNPSTIELLSRYIDGELTDRESETIAKQLQENEELQKTFGRLVKVDSLLKIATDQAVDRPLRSDTMALIDTRYPLKAPAINKDNIEYTDNKVVRLRVVDKQGTTGDGSTNTGTLSENSGVKRRKLLESGRIAGYSSSAEQRLFRTTRNLALAASAAFVFLGAGYLTFFAGPGTVGQGNPTESLAFELNQSEIDLLETGLSGTGNPAEKHLVLTFESVDGRYCREFISRSVRALACRNQKDKWQLVSSTPSRTGSSDSDGYELATGVDAPAFEKTVESLMNHEPLDQEQERKIISRGWK